MKQLDNRAIGERIARARMEAGAMTQEQLAELLNISTRSVQDYEAGKTIPWKHFSRLEEIFPGKSLGWFLHGDSEYLGESERLVAIRALEEATAAITRATEELTAALDRLKARLG